MGGARFWIGMVRRQTDCGGRRALVAAPPSLIPPGAMCCLPRIPSPEQPPSMEDGSWAAVRGGPHLHTVTRSEGHEGGGGIGVASISLAHPCMAPGLLPAWGGGRGNVGTDGTLGWGKGRDQTGTSDIKGDGRGIRPSTPKKGRPKARL